MTAAQANDGTDESYREVDAAQQDADGGRPARQGLARYARPALIAGAVIAVVCVALLVIIFFLDSFNATVYSVGGKDVTDATDEAKSIRESYAAARIGGIIFLVTGIVLAAAEAWCCTGTGTSPARTTRTTARTWTSRTSAAGSPAGPTPAGTCPAPGHSAWTCPSVQPRTRWACPSLGAGRGHDANVSTGRNEEWACPSVPPGNGGHVPRAAPISGMSTG